MTAELYSPLSFPTRKLLTIKPYFKVRVYKVESKQEMLLCKMNISTKTLDALWNKTQKTNQRQRNCKHLHKIIENCIFLVCISYPRMFELKFERIFALEMAVIQKLILVAMLLIHFFFNTEIRKNVFDAASETILD